MGQAMQSIHRAERRVKLRDLHILLAVVQSGSMSRAARELGVSQPVISKSIADLEDALGVSLLDRTAKGVEANAYGRTLLDCGVGVFDELRRGMQQIAFLADPTVGELRVGGAGPFIDGLIPAVISRMAERYPQIEFHVTESDPLALCGLLRERRIDLAILRISPSSYSDDLETTALFNEPLLVIAGLGHKLSRRRNIAPRDLLNEHWVMPEPNNVATALIADGFRAAGLTPPTPQAVSDSTTFRTRLVETGEFLSFLPGSTWHFGAGRLRVKVLPVTLPIKAPPTEVFTLKNRTPNPITRLFVAELHTLSKSLKTNLASYTGVSAGTGG
jgi:DNA-binding transcriptional LysR family regulator